MISIFIKKTAEVLHISLFIVITLTILSILSSETRVFAEKLDDNDFLDQRISMVRTQIMERGVNDADVIRAMKSVPRHKFVPDKYIASAYDDNPLPIGYGQTISQPYIVAYMTEVLKLNKNSTVLEVGTGSGYQAAVLSPVVKQVYTIEIISELAKSAAIRLKNLGYDNVEVGIGDGYYGWNKYAPFDAIIVTAAAGHIPPPLLKQLKNNGRMVIPVGGSFTVQNLILVSKDKDGNITTRNLIPVRFVPLTGSHN
ncbi:MAG TPA: protein-L-isoaspartate(D-aspartate) O-methyltransferase [Syntrophales bacterium]|nr:protein-L-isoaspartate(D-aspartate) O-methyltransferase [Syntrophales bacterium]